MSSDVKNVVDDAIRDAEREIEIKDIKHLVTDIESTISDAKERDENSNADHSDDQFDEEAEDDHDPYGEDYVNPELDDQESTNKDEKEEVEASDENEQGVPSSTVNLNSAIERSDPFAEEEPEVKEEKKSRPCTES